MPKLTLPDGRALAYREVGHGAPLVLVHGSPGDGRAWAKVASRLAGQFRVLTPDLPGYGESDPLPEAASGRTAAMAAAVAALIAACGEPAWLCGHSYGGNVALHASLRQADVIQGLALFEPVCFRALALAGQRQILESATQYFQSYTDRVAAGDVDAVADMVDYWFGAGTFPQLPQPMQAYLRGAAAANATDVRAALDEAMTVRQFADFSRPALLAYGDRSPAVVPAIIAALGRLLANAQSQTIRGANHGMLDSHPDAVAALIAGLAPR